MSVSWPQRKARLGALLALSAHDEDAEGLALDRILHGKSVIGKSSKTKEVDASRFTSADLRVHGTLENGSFGAIHLVTCKLDGRLYVRKSIEKRVALRMRDQCRPQLERDILLRATESATGWAPRLLCSFQEDTSLSLVMDYAEGGSLWDVLQSSPHNGRILEADLRWWAPQFVSAIGWCHDQGFAHRDVKPHNFVVTSTAHVLLIDFGSAAPLIPGSRFIPKKYCAVPCGTCDYISPEILVAHEDALVQLELEMDDEGDDCAFKNTDEDGEAPGYGVETDWWSLGAMLYEMAYGVAPFYAENIRQTYVRIMDHETSLRFNKSATISDDCRALMRGLLTAADTRLGRFGVSDIMQHPFFDVIEWDDLRSQPAPDILHLPEFTPMELVSGDEIDPSGTATDGFSFTPMFESSANSLAVSGSAPRPPETPAQRLSRSIPEQPAASSFIGFSWGPTLHAFDGAAPTHLSPGAPEDIHTTPRGPRATPRFFTPMSARAALTGRAHAFATPVRPGTLPRGGMSTLKRMGTTSTVRRRAVSDREAMQQLLSCVGMSARKKVLASGRRPRVLDAGFFDRPVRPSLAGTGSASRRSSVKKELRFVFDEMSQSQGQSHSVDASAVGVPQRSRTSSMGSAVGGVPQRSRGSSTGSQAQYLWVPGDGAGTASETETETETDADVPPSPSPSPRPGSAMSFMSMSRRSSTPTATMVTFGSAGLRLPALVRRRASSTEPGAGDSRTLDTPNVAEAPNGWAAPTSWPAAASAPIAGRKFSPPLEQAPSVLEEEAHGEEGDLDEMELRYTRLMSDIAALETRLQALRP